MDEISDLYNKIQNYKEKKSKLKDLSLEELEIHYDILECEYEKQCTINDKSNVIENVGKIFGYFFVFMGFCATLVKDINKMNNNVYIFCLFTVLLVISVCVIVAVGLKIYEDKKMNKIVKLSEDMKIIARIIEEKNEK